MLVDVAIVYASRCGNDLQSVASKPIWGMDTLSTSGEISLRWMLQNPTDDKST